MQPIQALLFDLGGVVLQVDFGRALAHWQHHSRLAPGALRQAFCMDEPYRRHETGALASDAYFEHLRGLLQLDCPAEAVRAGWNAILVAEIGETLRLVADASRRVPCYALSNTNPAHLETIAQRFPACLAPFRTVFVSSTIGHRKPDPPAFAHVAQAIGVPAAAVLFFDDLAENVAAARAFGMQAVLVRGPHDVADALRAHGLVEAGEPG